MKSRTGSPNAGGLARWTLSLAPIYFIGFAAFLFLYYRHDHPMWTDAWRLYELAQTVFGDFYKSNYVATYQMLNTGGHSADFPPLWPLVLAVTDRLLRTGLNSGYFAAFLCLALFMVVSEMVARELAGLPAIGFAVAGIVAASWWFQVELLAGQTMPMQLLLLSVILYVFIGAGPLGASRSFLLGILCGLAFLNRFDALPFAVAMIGVCGVAARTWRAAAIFATGLSSRHVAVDRLFARLLRHAAGIGQQGNRPGGRRHAYDGVVRHAAADRLRPARRGALKLVRYGGRLGVGLVHAFLGISALPSFSCQLAPSARPPKASDR